MSLSFIDQVRSIVMNKLADEKFGVRDLASDLDLSPSQTLRKIKAATGKSVNQYIREIRLEKAAELILETDYNASEVAYQVGFNSASYFNKSFSEYFGIPPGEYKTSSASADKLTRSKTEAPQKTGKNKLVYLGVILLIGVMGYLLMGESSRQTLGEASN